MTIVQGPSSNYINIFRGKKLKKELVWDPYCHYERKTKIIFNFEGYNETLSVEVPNEDIDRSSCRRNFTSWKELTPKFQVKEICYEGQIFSVTIDK